MSGAEQTVDRLLRALEDLVAGERSALKAGDYVTAVALQEQADPVVARLVELAPCADSGSRERVRRLVARRSEHGLWLREAQAQARGELTRMAEGQRVVARMAPVYGRMAGVGSAHFSGQA